tara:strand:- start:309 stop:560 length:252 start_codon:yes stop_codon:yes gene_type:complete
MTKTKLHNLLSKILPTSEKNSCELQAEINSLVHVSGRGKNWRVECENEKQLKAIKKTLKSFPYSIQWKGNGRIKVTSEYRHWK